MKIKFRRTGFTLAEVLITLAIIGVVAVLTVPNLMHNYKKKLIETRLLNFYSKINQAIALSEIDNGNKKFWWDNNNLPSCKGTDGYDEACLTEFFLTYLAPYLKYIKYEYMYANNLTPRLAVYLVDGSVARFGYYGHDIVYFPVAADVKKLKLCSNAFGFGFYPKSVSGVRYSYFYDKGVEPYIPYGWDGNESREAMYTFGEDICTKVIQLNNWKIPDDYPYKF